MNEIEEIKSKIDLVEYIGKYVQLKQTGRNFKACCPFHSEKTPSFHVSPERQIWRCFGACNEGGDIFSFVQKMDGVTFGEAIQMLADQAGVKLTQKNFEKSDSKKRVLTANELAEEHFQKNLEQTEGKKVRDYLKKRTLSAKTVTEFKIGFANGAQNDLLTELKKHGYTPQELEKMGLVAQKRGQLKDFFYNRLVFPIHDITGRPIGFSARILNLSTTSGQVTPGPKYINTPETEVFTKSNALYGIDLAKESIRKADNAIIVEGMMDVIASHQAGVKNVVAPGGTALTEGQLKLIGRLTKNIKFAFDVDFAGSEATRRAIEIAWELGFNIKVIEVPAGKDPADAVAEDPKMWKEAVKKSVYVIDYLFETAFKKFKKTDAIGKKMIGKELLPVIKRIPDEMEKDSYIKRLAKELGVSEESVRDTIKKISLPKEKRQEIKKEAKYEPKNKKAEMERNIIGLLMLFPHYLDFANNTLESSDFKEIETGQAFTKVLKYYDDNGEFAEGKFLNSLKKEERETFDHFILMAESNFEDFDDEKKAEEIYFGIKRLKKLSLEEKRRALSARIAQFETEGQKELAKKDLISLQMLIEEEKKLA